MLVTKPPLLMRSLLPLQLILLLSRGGFVHDDNHVVKIVDDFVDEGVVVGDNGGDDVTSSLSLYYFCILKQTHSTPIYNY